MVFSSRSMTLRSEVHQVMQRYWGQALQICAIESGGDFK